jgi:hypothetical protein
MALDFTRLCDLGGSRFLLFTCGHPKPLDRKMGQDTAKNANEMGSP